jgi:energy-coupling factor transporter ATP-binding protein EcfA2
MKLSVESLSFRYIGKKEAALTDINLEATGGELLFMVGGNGSGKTTLLSCIAGLMPDIIEGEISGQILLNGDKLGGSNKSPLLGFVLQEAEVYLFPRVEEEISFPLQNSGFSPAEIEKRVQEIADVFDIADLLGREMNTLSGGERQIVTIVTALIKDPPILLLDEPFEQLDPDAADNLLKLLQTIADKGKIIIIAVRSFDYVSSYGNRLIILRNGKIIASDSALATHKQSSLVPECLHSIALSASHRLKRENSTVTTGNRDVVCTRDLCYKYIQGGGIQDINLQLTPGETLAIMGPNGAGKTTLLKHFIGLLKAQKGMVIVMGQDAAKVPVPVLAQNIGILFQNPDDQIFNERIDKEIIWSLKTKRHCSWEKATAECQPIIENLGLKKIQKLHPHSVSRSYRQLIALATVLSSQPSLLILDEPCKSLDATHTSQLMSNLLSQSCGINPSIIMVTHDPYLTWAYSDRVALLVNGRLLAIGTPEEILCNQELTTQARLSKHPFVKFLQNRGQA